MQKKDATKTGKIDLLIFIRSLNLYFIRLLAIKYVNRATQEKKVLENP
jgi:hypothetical protein